MHSCVYVVYYRFLCFQIVILQNSKSRTWIQNVELKHELVYVLLSKFIHKHGDDSKLSVLQLHNLTGPGNSQQDNRKLIHTFYWQATEAKKNLQGCRITVGSTCRLKTIQHTKELAAVLFSSQSHVVQLNYSREHSAGERCEEGLCPSSFLLFLLNMQVTLDNLLNFLGFNFLIIVYAHMCSHLMHTEV